MENSASIFLLNFSFLSLSSGKVICVKSGSLANSSESFFFFFFFYLIKSSVFVNLTAMGLPLFYILPLLYYYFVEMGLFDNQKMQKLEVEQNRAVPYGI